LCNDFIISNSTFSWWVAWMSNSKDKKVFAPYPWFGPALAHIDTEGYYSPKMNIIKREIEKV